MKRHVTRTSLGDYLGKNCKCKGLLHAKRYKSFNYGVNTGNKLWFLLKNVNVDGKVLVDHVWINTTAFKEIPFGSTVTFQATIQPYRKLNNSLSFGLVNATDVEIVEKD